jgi:hypothetical protein
VLCILVNKPSRFYVVGIFNIWCYYLVFGIFYICINLMLLVVLIMLFGFSTHIVLQ